MDFSKNQLSSGVVLGAVLVIAGTLLFLSNLGYVSIDLSQMFWPVILAVWGVGGFCRVRRVQDIVWPVTMLVASLLLFLSGIGVIRYLTLFSLWPLALIAAGLTTMTSGLGLRQLTSRFTGASTLTRLRETAVFSGVKRRIETAGFEGGELSCLFGGIDIDLRRSSANGDVTIEANAVFGGIELKVPENWVVIMQGFAMFGGYEDKTIPPRPEPGVPPTVLTICGNTAFGGVSVRN